MDGRWEIPGDILMDDVLKLEDEFLEHYGRSVLEGAPIGSGRYRYGSGDSAYQHEKSFRQTVQALRNRGMLDEDIRKSFGMKSNEFRSRISYNKEQIMAYERDMCRKLKEKGMSNTDIAYRLYRDRSKENTVRNRLKEANARKDQKFEATKQELIREVEKYGMIDVGPGSEYNVSAAVNMKITETRLKNVLTQLEKEGYKVHTKFSVDQYGRDSENQTTVKVLTKGDIPTKELYKQLNEGTLKIAPAGMDRYWNEDKMQFDERRRPESISSDRIFIKYADADGSNPKDGVIELRRGVPELSLGNAHYAQVRIGVDGTHYMKGMAMYSDDIPAGYDVVYNVHRKEGTPLFHNPDPNGETVFKAMDEKHPANPFGANIQPDEKLHLAVNREWTDKDGNEHKSAVCIVNEEGKWNDWSRNISAQMLSKQPPELAKRQLDMTYEAKAQQLKDIMALTNPTVKKKLLEDFANSCDSDAVHLKAYGFPGQAGKVILPIEKLPPNQIYAPGYDDGTEVVLIRYPHASITEIPSLTVNNHHPEAKKILGDAIDAVGINPKVAQQLSGADFDGDTVYVIPNQHGDIRHEKQYKELVGFDTQEAYPGYPGMKVISKPHQQKMMGVVTNLITDMTIANADDKEIMQAMKHSMVIIDAYKHKLDWKRSEKENHILDFIEKYQVKPDGSTGGASTLISRAKSTVYVNQRRLLTNVNKMTPEQRERYLAGEKIYVDTGKTKKIWKTEKEQDPTNRRRKIDKLDENGKKIYYDTGEERIVQQTSTQMAEHRDARDLISKHNSRIERIYARYANQMKDLAAEARREMLKTPNLKYDPEAKKHYEKEVKSLENKLVEAKKNSALERQALILANIAVKQYEYDNPNIRNDNGAYKKLKGRTLNEKRLVTGAIKKRVTFSDREWEAIQAGAVHHSFLLDLMKNADSKDLKERAMPKTGTTISPARVNMIKNKLRQGFGVAAIVDQLDIPKSQVEKIQLELRGEGSNGR